MKYRFNFIIMFAMLLISCEAEMTSHLEHLESTAGLHVGSRVVNDDMETIGEVTDLFDEDGVIMNVEISYLKYPSAVFSTTMDHTGETVVIASYPEEE